MSSKLGWMNSVLLNLTGEKKATSGTNKVPYTYIPPLPLSKQPVTQDGEDHQEDGDEAKEGGQRPHQLEHCADDLLHGFPVPADTHTITPSHTHSMKIWSSTTYEHTKLTTNISRTVNHWSD